MSADSQRKASDAYIEEFERATRLNELYESLGDPDKFPNTDPRESAIHMFLASGVNSRTHS